MDFPASYKNGFQVRVKNLKYSYTDSGYEALRGLDLEINAGEVICITGAGNSGKTTLTNIITGLYTNYEGVVAINNYSLRDLDITHMRDQVAKNISSEDLFDGTLLENITLGKN